MFKAMLIAGLGGFVGTCFRFLTGRLAQHLGAAVFPWGTFAVNMLGCLAIGLLFGLAEKTHAVSPSMNLFLITGFCGGFTTFSTFGDDLYLLLRQGHAGHFALYLSSSLVLGVLLVWLGRALVRGAGA